MTAIKRDEDFEEINKLIEDMRLNTNDPHKMTFGLRVLQDFIADCDVNIYTLRHTIANPKKSETFMRVADICRP